VTFSRGRGFRVATRGAVLAVSEVSVACKYSVLGSLPYLLPE